MREIKIKFSKGGKVQINAAKVTANEVANFTEKLAKELGTVEERHKGEQFETGHNTQQVQQK